MKHSILSPSAAHRWIACPGSVSSCSELADKGYDLNGTTPEADFGTQCHDLAAGWLRKGAPPKTADPEQAELVRLYVETVQEYPHDAHWYEHPVSLAWLAPGKGLGVGRLDAAVEHGDTLTVYDLKSGFTRVNARNNPQLLIYAESLIRAKRRLRHIKDVELVIVQPRLPDGVSRWSLSREELTKLAGRLKACAQVALAQNDLPPWLRVYRPSEHACAYCPARGWCRAVKETGERALAAVDGGVMCPDELADAISKAKLLRAWCDEVTDPAIAALQNGTDVPGYTLGKPRLGPRKWTENALNYLKTTLGDAAFTLKSPAQLQKDLDKDIIDSLTTRTEGRPELIPIREK